MGWLRSVGSLELQVSFAKETYDLKETTNRRHFIVSIIVNEAVDLMYLLEICSGVATISMLLQMIDLFCRIYSFL